MRDAERALVGDATLKLRCEPCGRTVVLGRAQAGRMFGLGAKPTTVRARARCGVCVG